jgi:hypothetical protein
MSAMPARQLSIFSLCMVISCSLIRIRRIAEVTVGIKADVPGCNERREDTSDRTAFGNSLYLLSGEIAILAIIVDFIEIHEKIALF